MRSFIAIAAVAAAVTAVPAAAQERGGEGRVEARAGIAWAAGNSEAFAGIEGGYDFDLGESAFIGVQASADKVLVKGANVIWGVGGRIGAKVGEKGKIYALGGYAFSEGDDAAFIGAGFQHKFGSKLYGKIEYRRTLNNGTDVNFAGLGLGAAF